MGWLDYIGQQMAQAQAKVQTAQLASQDKQADMALRKQMNDDNNQTKVLVEQMKLGQDDKHLQQEAIGMTIETQENAQDRQAEDARTAAQMQHTAEQADIDRKVQTKESMLDRTLKKMGLRKKEKANGGSGPGS